MYVSVHTTAALKELGRLDLFITFVGHLLLNLTVMSFTFNYCIIHFVASELKDPICHSDECQIGSFSSEATICSSLIYDLMTLFTS